MIAGVTMGLGRCVCEREKKKKQKKKSGRIREDRL